MIQELDLRGKVALVTGAKQGIGRAIAGRFAECGALIAALDLSLKENDTVCLEVTGVGSTCLPISADISREDDVNRAFAAVKGIFGRIDILVNNAGITRDAMSKNMTAEQFRHVLDVNLVGTFLCAQQAMAMMRESGNGGAIVNFSSVVAYAGNVGQANYCASKAGVLGLTRSLALEGARDHIRVNAVAPGFVETSMTDAIPEKLKQAAIERIPLGRTASPRDLANAALFLATDMSSFITGQCLHVNGGRYM